MSQKKYFTNFQRYLHDCSPRIKKCYFKSPCDFKTASFCRSDTYGSPCSLEQHYSKLLGTLNIVDCLETVDMVLQICRHLNFHTCSVHIACGLRLGATLCHPHECNCDKMVESNGRHGLQCKQARGRKMRHKEVNKLIRHGLDQDKIPSTLEPIGLSKRGDKNKTGWLNLSNLEK